MAATNRREDKPIPPPVLIVRTSTSIIPTALLDADSRQRFLDQGAALADADVLRSPSYLEGRIEWIKGVAATAWTDRDSLTKVPLDDGKLTVDEVRDLGACAEHLNVVYLRWCDARATGTTAMPGSATATRIATLMEQQRGLQKKFLAAFDLRFKNNPSGRALLSDIRKGKSLLNKNVRILRLCNSEEHRAWLAELPKGEAEAAKKLATLHAELAELVGTDAYDPATLKDLLDRAWTVCSKRLDRVLTAGRYLVNDNPARKSDYASYKMPKPHKPRAKKSDPTAPKPTPA